MASLLHSRFDENGDAEMSRYIANALVKKNSAAFACFCMIFIESLCMFHSAHFFKPHLSSMQNPKRRASLFIWNPKCLHRRPQSSMSMEGHLEAKWLAPTQHHRCCIPPMPLQSCLCPGITEEWMAKIHISHWILWICIVYVLFV